MRVSKYGDSQLDIVIIKIKRGIYMRITKILIMLLVLSVVLSGCAKKSDMVEKDDEIVTDVSIEEAKEIIESQENLIILDVRTKEEFDAGHIEGAIQIPVEELKNRVSEIEEYKDEPLLVYCRSGNRSSKAVDILVDNDFTNIKHMNQGYMNWK